MNPEQPRQSSSEQPENTVDSIVEKLYELHQMMQNTLDDKEGTLEEMDALVRKLENAFGEYKETQEKLTDLQEELESVTDDERQWELRNQISDLYRQSRDLKKECISLHEELEENDALQGELREKAKDIRGRFKLLDSFSTEQLPRKN